MRQSLWLLSLGVSMLASAAQAAPYMIVGNDEKLVWDDQGKPVLSASGRDSVLIIDLADPETPKISANLPIKNSSVGPPVGAPSAARPPQRGLTPDICASPCSCAGTTNGHGKRSLGNAIGRSCSGHGRDRCSWLGLAPPTGAVAGVRLGADPGVRGALDVARLVELQEVCGRDRIRRRVTAAPTPTAITAMGIGSPMKTKGV